MHASSLNRLQFLQSQSLAAYGVSTSSARLSNTLLEACVPCTVPDQLHKDAHTDTLKHIPVATPAALCRNWHADVLEWLWFLNSHPDVTYKSMYGDKDTFRLAFHLAGKASEFWQARAWQPLSVSTF